jgi:hypothetical protein
MFLFCRVAVVAAAVRVVRGRAAAAQAGSFMYKIILFQAEQLMSPLALVVPEVSLLSALWGGSLFLMVFYLCRAVAVGLTVHQTPELEVEMALLGEVQALEIQTAGFPYRLHHLSETILVMVLVRVQQGCEQEVAVVVKGGLVETLHLILAGLVGQV